jgi:hypothetical protein
MCAAVERHARQLLFWNFFLFGEEKSAAFLFLNGIIETNGTNARK